ncbi:MAG: EamA family transporter [Oscillospiraceae bacterium]|nr:EamA family transporter [Oscillospiraceae bacterium]
MDRKPLIKSGTPLVISAAVLWGMMGIFVRRLNSFGFSSMEIVAVRVFFAAVLMAAVLVIKDRSLFKIKLKDAWCFVGTGLCSIVFFNFCYFRSIELTSLSAAAVMLYTAPVMVTAMSAVIFREKLTALEITAAVSAFAGCALVTGIAGGGFSVTGEGLLTGLGSAFGYALYSIFGRLALNRGYTSFTITFYTFLFASAGVIPFADIADTAVKTVSSAECLVTGILLALLITVAPYLLYTAGLEKTETGKASVMASAEPVTATLIGAVLFSESLDVSGIIGIFLVICSVILLNISHESGKNAVNS